MCRLVPHRVRGDARVDLGSDGHEVPPGVTLLVGRAEAEHAVRLCVLECDHGHGWELVPWPTPGEALEVAGPATIRLVGRSKRDAVEFDRLNGVEHACPECP